MENPNKQSNLPERKKEENCGDNDTQKLENKIHWKKARLTLAIFGIIECFSLVLWQEAEVFNGSSADFIHWISKCGFLAGGAFLAHKAFKKPLRVWISYLIMCFIILIAKPSGTPQHQFSFMIFHKQIEMKQPIHFLVWDASSSTNGVRAPIQIMMWARFVNLNNRPLTIDWYQFEGKATNGTWEIMPTIDTANGWVVMTGNIRVDPGENVFPEIIYNKTINYGQTISGWVFLEAPKHGFDGTMRLRIRDSIGAEYVEMVGDDEEKSQLDTRTEAVESYRILPFNEDIGKYKTVTYSDFFKNR
jgi:hypothetical protein